MLIGQKRSRLKRLSKFILLAAILSGEALPYFSQTVAVESSRKSLHLEKPLKPCWNFPGENFDGDKIASDNESSFLPTMDGRLISVNSKTGLKNWDTDFGGRLKAAAELSESENAIFIVSNVESDQSPNESDRPDITTGNDSVRFIVRRLDKETGVVVWQTVISVEEKNTADKNSDAETIYLHSLKGKLLVNTNFGNFYLLDSLDGKIQIKVSLQTEISNVSPFSDSQFIAFGAERRIIVLSAKDLSKVTEVEVTEKPLAILWSLERLIWGDERGTVNSVPFAPNFANLAMSKASKANKANKSNKWKLRTGGKILSLAPVGKTIIAASLDNYIYAVAMSDGRLLWKKRLANRPAFNPVIIDNYAVLTTIGDSVLEFIEVKTGRTVNKINAGERFFYTGAPQVVGSMIILPTDSGLSAYTSEKICGE